MLSVGITRQRNALEPKFPDQKSLHKLGSQGPCDELSPQNTKYYCRIMLYRWIRMKAASRNIHVSKLRSLRLWTATVGVLTCYIPWTEMKTTSLLRQNGTSQTLVLPVHMCSYCILYILPSPTAPQRSWQYNSFKVLHVVHSMWLI